MPRRDGTGPIGAGVMTGRGLGLCTGVNEAKLGTCLALGLGFRRRRHLTGGFARGFRYNNIYFKTQKHMLQEQKNILQNSLEAIDKQLQKL